MIKNVIFDIGNVLVSFDWASYLDSFSFDPETREHVANAVFLSPIWNDRDRGGETEEYYRNAMVAADPAYEEEIRRVMEHCERTCVEYPFSADWVKTIKKQGYRVFLLSNYSKYMYELQEPTFHFLPLTDGAVISYRHCLRKPEPEIYQILLDTYQLHPEECVFLDDTAANLEAAESFGIQTIHVTSHDAALRGLEALGIASSIQA